MKPLLARLRPLQYSAIVRLAGEFAQPCAQGFKGWALAHGVLGVLAVLSAAVVVHSTRQPSVQCAAAVQRIVGKEEHRPLRIATGAWYWLHPDFLVTPPTFAALALRRYETIVAWSWCKLAQSESHGSRPCPQLTMRVPCECERRQSREYYGLQRLFALLHHQRFIWDMLPYVNACAAFMIIESELRQS